MFYRVLILSILSIFIFGAFSNGIGYHQDEVIGIVEDSFASTQYRNNIGNVCEDNESCNQHRYQQQHQHQHQHQIRHPIFHRFNAVSENPIWRFLVRQAYGIALDINRMIVRVSTASKDEFMHVLYEEALHASGLIVAGIIVSALAMWAGFAMGLFCGYAASLKWS